MARMEGVSESKIGWMTRLIFWFAKRKIGKLTGEARLVEPLKITAHHPKLLMALGRMEMGQDSAKSVPPALKSLASLKTAMLIGCSF